MKLNKAIICLESVSNQSAMTDVTLKPSIAKYDKINVLPFALSLNLFSYHCLQ